MVADDRCASDGQHFPVSTWTLVQCLSVLACAVSAFRAVIRLKRFLHVQLSATRTRQIHPADGALLVEQMTQGPSWGVLRPSFSL